MSYNFSGKKYFLSNEKYWSKNAFEIKTIVKWNNFLLQIYLGKKIHLVQKQDMK